MTFRKEEKLRIATGKIFDLRKWIEENEGKILYPTRVINSIYFDNQIFSMFNQSIEGVLPRKKIRLRVYSKNFFNSHEIKKEVKISSVEGRYKISEITKDPLQLINLGIYDQSYGLCHPVLNVLYKRNYYIMNDIRITLDENIVYKNITNNKISQFSIPDKFNIIEIKYSNEKPEKLISSTFPFERCRFSKYCRGIEFIKLNYCNEL